MHALYSRLIAATVSCGQLVINRTIIMDLVAILTLSAVLFVTANPEEKDEGNLQDLSIANSDFAFNLLRKINDSRNAFVSPFSISQVFGMLLYGARGDTAEFTRAKNGYTS
ncbi:hypothetical protein TNCV_994751 [Trichonephila clavipes]|nr:hypothetical protein TNCV_994751 [Trichonephila clavipes]